MIMMTKDVKKYVARIALSSPMSVPEETARARLSLIKAEQRKVESLKHLNLPWVFIEPTRIGFAKASKRPKAGPPRNDDDELGFLLQSKTPFTSADMEILTGAIHHPAQIAPAHSLDFRDAAEEIRLQREQDAADRDQALRFPNTGSSTEYIPDDDQELLTERSAETDALFVPDEESQVGSSRLNSAADIPEPDEVKTLIMSQLEDKHPAQSSHPVQLSQYEAMEGSAARAGPPTLGRKRLIEAIERASSLTYERDAVTFAKRKLAKESALKAAALESCFGVQSFRRFLDDQKLKVPESFPNVNLNECK
jgi:hypothetical protein